ncbi:hypothetical protein [Variovorax paradoxus]|uniref:hypothetical protein n=1 Tax=Variovorax paradoxus TaxID=34073 RepID=UPI001ABC6458
MTMKVLPPRADIIERMKATLSRIHTLAGTEFSGIGLVVHNSEPNLPVFPLRPNAELPVDREIEPFLAAISSTTNDLHDGFHLLSIDWKLTALSQYFSPPILANAEINWKRKFGGRYLAAQFGSALPGVQICAIATSSLGLAIFNGGREIYFERL